ncbi:hypothetical protein F4860DRAFT_514581 [Xylaria cubensis]|nr:hypothetical protein F4860DRAFT_514581 [Xylaria cubensis]
MTTVKSALWWVVLLSCHHAITVAKDHHSIDDKPYKRLAIRSNATGTLDNASSSVTILSTPSSTRTKQDTSPQPHVSSDAASDTSFTVPRILSVEGIGIATPIDRSDGSVSTAGARDSDARVFGDTFIASITTFLRPPLAAPSDLANQRNSTNLAFPTFSPSVTYNVTTTTTTTKGQYTNSSTVTRPGSTTAFLPTTTEDFCTSTNGPFSTVIEYSIIHTWTITWLGDPADYTPPFPTISAPRPCTPTTTSATGRFTISVCDSSGQSCSLIHVTGEPTPTAPTDPWWVWITDTSAIRGMEPTLTFVTTDRNPAVVFPTSLPPDYGGSPDPKGNVHSAAYPNEAQSPDPPGYGSEATTKQNVKSASLAPPITVIVKPGVVVIDDQTFTNDPAQPTSTVVVDQNTFTINPTQVIGVDATLTRPLNGGVTPPQPTETTISGIGVSIVEGSSVVVLDKTSFTIGPNPSTVTIRGQAITIGPGAIVFPSQTLGIPVAQDTTQVVFGAELITAVGSDKVIIEGRTIIYGPGSSTITEIIDGDTILIGPSGIIAHGETYGGSHATSTETQFAVVGGVTISQIGSTVVVIQGVTHTLDPLVPGQIKTTVIGGERITIGPEGVGIESWTLDSPYASTTTITPNSGPTVVMPTATATATAGNPNKENDGSSLASKQPHWLLVAGVGLTAYFLRIELLLTI